jgi:NAD(P)-dependent dehydrogenase (short-subunit alcohol dehydrogenase family)
MCHIIIPVATTFIAPAGRAGGVDAHGDHAMAEIVVVTGATSGVGRAVAAEFARQGAHVGLLARGRDGLEGARQEVERLGGRALAIPTDVADPEQVEAAASRVEESLGPIDTWVNDAMVTVFAPFSEIEPEEFRRATEVTYLGTVWGTKAALKRMRLRDRGSIVLVGSALAYRGIPLQAAYCGAKHAIKGFFESVRTELMHEGSHVRISMVQLPGVNTPQFDHCLSKMPRHPMPVPPIYQPEVAARAVVYAAHHRRRQVYVGAPTFMTIWGNRLLPWVADRYLAKTGYKSQQTEQPASPDRPSNLFEPVPGDPGAHGRFDDRAHAQSPLLELSLRRGAALAGVAAVASTASIARLIALRSLRA